MIRDVSFSRDIRPLITSEDVTVMRRCGIDHASVKQVRRNARTILPRLADRTMPPGRPWSDEQIALFRAWADGGMAP
jgi:hypothetical protein